MYQTFLLKPPSFHPHSSGDGHSLICPFLKKERQGAGIKASHAVAGSRAGGKDQQFKKAGRIPLP